MADLKTIGTIKEIGDLQTFDSGFTKVEFVIETDEKYPQMVKFEAIKEKAEKFLKINKVGDRVRVSFNLRGNEYNGKYYVNLQSWYVESMDSNEADGTTSHKTRAEADAEAEGSDDLPF